ncbi:hypothetical protein J2T55_000994 [Methylohalomonas lacus]|uniref:Adhesin n=2 Tax=Methylohalomonas lacus TaxID=398773 RepID=A0AAE3HKU0_9GAMM|nr:hypothetical protein [Methylohalomonas lacus]
MITALAVSLLTAAPALAQELSPANSFYSARTILNGNALSGVTGAINVNMAAGDNNLQNNAGTMALGEYAHITNLIVQRALLNSGFAPDKASVRIGDRAFSNAVGWITVNQAAGQTNVQSNTMGMALGIKGSSLTDMSLGQVLSNQQILTGDPDSGTPQRQIEIESSTFSGARGIIQVNQSAGTGNATRNSFSLQMGP